MSNQSDEEAVLDARATFAPIFNEGDYDKVCALFADDVIIIPADREASVGRQSARRLYAEFEEIPDIQIITNPVTRVEVDGDLAYTVGSYTFHYTTSNRPVAHYGRSLEVWRRQQDGSWKMIVDMWHDLPEGVEPVDLAKS